MYNNQLKIAKLMIAKNALLSTYIKIIAFFINLVNMEASVVQIYR